MVTRRAPLCPRVRLVVDLFEARPRDVGVDLRRGEVRVSEELLHEPQIRPAVEQVRRETVPESVGGNAGDAGATASMGITRCQENRKRM